MSATVKKETVGIYIGASGNVKVSISEFSGIAAIVRKFQSFRADLIATKTAKRVAHLAAHTHRNEGQYQKFEILERRREKPSIPQQEESFHD